MKKLLVLGLAVVCAACTTTAFQVSEKDNGGIAFHETELIDVTTQTYAQEWVEATLDVTTVPEADKDTAKGKEPAKPPKGGLHRKRIVLLDAADGRALLDKCGTANGDDIAELMNHKWTPPSIDVWTIDMLVKQAPLSVTHQRSARASTTIRYFNVQSPPGGSVTGSVELKDDGRLGKAEGGGEDKLTQTLVTGVATVGAALVTAALGAAAVMAFEGGGPKTNLVLACTVKPLRRIYELSLVRPLSRQDDPCTNDEIVRSLKERVWPYKCEASLKVGPEDTKPAKEQDDAKSK